MSFPRSHRLTGQTRSNEERIMQKIITYLWFDNQAEEAATFYTSLFADSRILQVQRQGGGSGSGGIEDGPAGTAMMVDFELAGQRFLALNGGPQFPFTEAISLFVDCADQAEVDDLWARLTADGGEESSCGWLKDKYGVSWQIIPKALPELLGDPDPAKAGAVLQAMLKMNKIDVPELQAAYDSAG
jgi:predicted 3-demethylubiquinone-9 3-methyltransferase (glyoxalase superfamily)